MGDPDRHHRSDAGPAAGAGAGAAIPGVQKRAAEAAKAQREAEAAQFNLAHQKTTALLNIVGSATDQASYDLAKKNAFAGLENELDVSRLHSPILRSPR